ncbi:MAG: DUF115 domain-containing protein [Methanobrevibacter sp.]|jgi:uncharacterized Rossmann fold enzyme|nr:DUF115 domain-containing protein [Methanobrevibacter sp.]
MFDFDKWEIYYEKILDDFGFSRVDDEKSAESLNEILKNRQHLSFNELKAIVDEKTDFNTTFLVFGAGLSLEKHVKIVKQLIDGDIDYLNICGDIVDLDVLNGDVFNNKVINNNLFIIAADGTTSGLLEENIVPDIVVSDLDGKIEDLLKADAQGSIFVIHGHGNNLDLICKYTNDFNLVLGTTQSVPFENIYNFGGFTDGDRAVFLAVNLGAKKIVLAGMDFGEYVTKYSRPNLDNEVELADEVKKKKLQYAYKLVKWLMNNSNADIKFLK